MVTLTIGGVDGTLEIHSHADDVAAGARTHKYPNLSLAIEWMGPDRRGWSADVGVHGGTLMWNRYSEDTLWKFTTRDQMPPEFVAVALLLLPPDIKEAVMP